MANQIAKAAAAEEAANTAAAVEAAREEAATITTAAEASKQADTEEAAAITTAEAATQAAGEEAAAITTAEVASKQADREEATKLAVEEDAENPMCNAVRVILPDGDQDREGKTRESWCQQRAVHHQQLSLPSAACGRRRMGHWQQASDHHHTFSIVTMDRHLCHVPSLDTHSRHSWGTAR